MTVIGHGYDDNVGAPAFRNVIINGGMNVAQRTTSATGITTSSGYNSLDRWRWDLSSGEAWSWTMAQNTDAPTDQGFGKALKVTANTGDNSLLAAAYNVIYQQIEGQNMQHFCKGTTNAKDFALQFWVKASIVGNFVVEVYDTSNSRHICKLFSINQANTWEKKTFVFPKDTTGTLINDNADRFRLHFWLGAGTNYTTGTLPSSWATIVSANRAVGCTNFGASNGNTFAVTGVQLEASSVATPFEFEPFETTLRKCMRYYEVSSTNQLGAMNWSSSNDAGAWIPFVVYKRSAPVIAGGCSYNGGVAGTLSFPTNTYGASNSGFSLTANVAASAGKASVYYGLNWTANAEL